MMRLSRLAAVMVYVLALAGVWLLAGSRYDWMSSIDPALADAVIETDGSRDLVAVVLLVLALCAAAILAASSRSRDARVTSLVLVLLALAFYGISRA